MSDYLAVARVFMARDERNEENEQSHQSATLFSSFSFHSLPETAAPGVRIIKEGTIGTPPRAIAYHVTEGESHTPWRRCLACRAVVEPLDAVCRECHPQSPADGREEEA